VVQSDNANERGWQAMAIQYAPNPGFAKMVINLNTVWHRAR
jgi:hypothetical protein